MLEFPFHGPPGICFVTDWCMQALYPAIQAAFVFPWIWTRRLKNTNNQFTKEGCMTLHVIQVAHNYDQPQLQNQECWTGDFAEILINRTTFCKCAAHGDLCNKCRICAKVFWTRKFMSRALFEVPLENGLWINLHLHAGEAFWTSTQAVKKENNRFFWQWGAIASSCGHFFLNWTVTSTLFSSLSIKLQNPTVMTQNNPFRFFASNSSPVKICTRH